MPQQKIGNQRILEIKKEPTDTKHKYTANNLAALDQAARLLTSKGGFKLYMYLARHQETSPNKENWKEYKLYSSNFLEWASLGYTAYTSAFKELETHGYLIQSETDKDRYIFYDKAQHPVEPQKKEEPKIIEYSDMNKW